MREIKLNGPSKNALSTALMAQIRKELGAAAGGPVLFTGEADAFSAGLDLREVMGLDEKGMETFLRALDSFFLEIYSYPGPTVAAVNGHAIAGGCVLALCCDHRVVASNPKLKMGLNEVALGLHYPPATLRISRSRVAQAHEVEVLLGAQLFGPQDALRMGLVDEVAEDPLARARERLELLSRHPSDAYAACKHALREPHLLRPSDEDALAAIVPAWVAPSLKERLGALLTRKS